MRKVLKVFTNDFKKAAHNTAALIIVAGLCLLPSLYAWINIYACWDPYSNTGNLPVAIVNKDEGAVYNGKLINVGDSIVEQLKANPSVDWDFIDEWQGNYGLNEGKYYALIEIPSNFSQNLTSLGTATPQKPSITYKVNEKLNAIAAKITNVVKDKLVDSIKTNFVSTVNAQVISSIKEQSSQQGSASVSDLKNAFTQANSDISALQQYIAQQNTDSEEFQRYLNSVTTLLPKITEQIDSLEKVTEAAKSLSLHTKGTMDSLSTVVNSDIIQMQSLNEKNKSLLTQLKGINENTIHTDVIHSMQESVNICGAMDILLKSDAETLKNANKSYNFSALSLMADSFNYMDQLVKDEKDKLNELIPLLSANTSKDDISAAIEALASLSDEFSQQTQKTSNLFYTNASPALSNMVGDLTNQLDNTNDLIRLTKAITPQLSALTAFGTATSQLSVQEAGKFSGLLADFQGNLNKLLDKMDGITNENVEKTLDIIENHPAEVADFIASPLDVKEVEVYEGGTFGVGLTPFYTVLAIWVGSLLLCALLSVECDDSEIGEKLNLKQKHFGKMMMFLVLSLIQSTIITLGDVILLGVKPQNLPLMMVFSVLSSLTFTVIIFTLVSLFGNVGKAIAVVIMVFQIAGSGGIYPIQTNPHIFGMLQPLWPFTYAINGYREAIAGPVWNSVYWDIAALFAFTAVFLLLAALKKPFHKLNTVLERKYKEADL